VSADGFLVDAAQIRRHAGQLEAVRARFGAVKSASAHIARDDAAYGLLCSWLPAVLEGRHQRQDSLLAYVEENLALAAEALTAVAGAYADVDAVAAAAIHKAGGRR